MHKCVPARRIAGDEQAERSGGDVEDVDPAVDGEDPEQLRSTLPGLPKEAL